MERLEKLMAEWGFQDMATAEAFWRRQQHQLQVGIVTDKIQIHNSDRGLHETAAPAVGGHCWALEHSVTHTLERVRLAKLRELER